MQLFKTGILVFTLLATELTFASAEKIVESFHRALISAMKAETGEKRESIVEEAIKSHFNVYTIARISLGRNWRALETEDQEKYISLMQELISTTYSSRFNNYDGQFFTVTNSTPIGNNRSRVNTTLTTKSEIVNLDYQLQFSKENWRVYDIVANGVSDLSLKRSNYTSLFADGGLEAVSADIRASIKKNQEESSG